MGTQIIGDIFQERQSLLLSVELGWGKLPYIRVFREWGLPSKCIRCNVGSKLTLLKETRGATRRGRQPLFGITVEKGRSHQWWRNLSDRRFRRFVDGGGRSYPNYDALCKVASIP